MRSTLCAVYQQLSYPGTQWSILFVDLQARPEVARALAVGDNFVWCGAAR